MKIHFMGVGGAGTSAATALAKESGFEVSGCDIDQSSLHLPELKKLGIKIEGAHDPAHLKDLDLLVPSEAITKLDSENEELLEAKKRNLTILPTEKFVADYLAHDKFLIAVAGSHGKSTTTAMVGQILEEANLDPTVYVGSIVTKWGKNYRFGKSKYLVLEADEYEDKFLNYKPNLGVVTNIEYDHPDYFENVDQIIASFVKFVKGFAKESRLVLGTDPSESKTIESFVKEIGNFTSVIKDYNWYLKNFGMKLPVPGKHNQANALAAYLCARYLGVSEETVERSLSSFSGTSRRFEFKGEVNGIKIFDDYAHHPTEVAATLSAAREKFPGERIWCIFQPHTFSRTKALFNEFVKSFDESAVDKLILVDIYAARENDPGDITSFNLAKEMKSKKAAYIGDIEEAATYVAGNVAAGDVVIAMGAGDIYKLPQILQNKLEGQRGRRFG